MRAPLQCCGVIATLAVTTTLAQVPCPPPQKPAACASLIPGTPLPFANPLAPQALDLQGATAVELHILGHSENRGYDPYLRQMLNQAPPLPGVTFKVTNHWIGGHEAWRWATPGERGYSAIQSLLRNRRDPAIVLGLFSNNKTFPIQSPNYTDPNFVRFVDDLEKIADLLHDSGSGVLMTYFSAHRYKVTNVLPCYYENCGVGQLMIRGRARSKAYLDAGPEQHDLHWCCFPSCYAADLVHTNQLGDQLMAEAWYNFLVRKLTGCATVPYGEGTAGTGGRIPVLGPTGGFPKVGNTQYGLHTANVLGGAPIAYTLGAAKLPGPLLVQPIVIVPAAASAAGVHDLPLPIPTNPSLHGGVVRVQTLALDLSAPLFLAATQGLEVRVCR